MRREGSPAHRAVARDLRAIARGRHGTLPYTKIASKNFRLDLIFVTSSPSGLCLLRGIRAMRKYTSPSSSPRVLRAFFGSLALVTAPIRLLLLALSSEFAHASPIALSCTPLELAGDRKSVV